MRKKIKFVAQFTFITLMFLCAPNVLFAATREDDELFVFADGASYILERAVSASGEKYEATDDPTTVFWSDGPEAILEIKGRAYSKYVLLRESGEDELLLTVDGKNYTMKYAASASGAKYEALEDPETILWSKGDAATLIVEGNEYDGYDVWQPDGVIWLADQGLPTEIEWEVASIAGSEVIEGSTVTLTFHADGSLSGLASVNNYRASWMASGSRIIITANVSTMMGIKPGGPSALMEQERAFLGILPEVVRFQFRKDGLTLVSGSGEEIILVRK
ncbi:MAG: MliC family protein [Synergistaceae bacterium]|jgi:membrane-bound inhibitor of C-type lysozyme|nr:MliC family protein [Synergistaceae bacterium]